MNVKKHLINVVVAILLSVLLSSMIGMRPKEVAFLNTIYTISGIMFSIGMGILCTLNPDVIKNQIIYKRVKSNIISVRNSYLVYFAFISFPYLILQIFFETKYIFEIQSIKIVFDLYYATIVLNILSIIYFITNFLAIQKLNFEISDRIRDG